MNIGGEYIAMDFKLMYLEQNIHTSFDVAVFCVFENIDGRV